MNVLVVDVGGTHVKVLVSGQSVPRKFESGATLVPKSMVLEVQKTAADWSYDVVSIGYPGPVLKNRPVAEPHNLASGWVGFNFEAAFARPVKLINDAAMQALGSYKGGKMLFLGLGTGLGYAIAARIARPSAQVVLLLGDGAAGFSLMDADTLVRHKLPVVMICCTNGNWGLEKHIMRALYGYDVAADLQPQCRYDQVVTALGGAGELVTSPAAIGPALRRAFDSGVPYLVNIVTDPQVAYPRSTVGV